jgi:hypothetical protein
LLIATNNLTGPTKGLLNVLSDTGNFLKNLADWDTYKTVVATFPLYTASRMIDQNIHTCFYDHHHHRHINQVPCGLCTFADEWVVPTFAGINGFLLLSKNDRLRQTSKLFLIGLPLLIWTTDIFKHFCYSEFCLRPLHERFCKDHKRVRRGFPSTHAADCAFFTTLFGLQFGPRAAVPLTLVSAVVIGCFINDNRHYLSQIVAGGGLGVLFALAANKVVDKNMSQDLQFKFDVTERGSPALALSWKF